MKTATPFFSEFFQTDCLVVEGVPHFSITGATKTLYGAIGGSSAESLRKHLLKTATQTNTVTSVDLSDFPGIEPVKVESTDTQGGRARDAVAMSQATFEALLFQYWQKDTKAGEYARKIIRQLVGVSMDLILRKEAGLMHEEAAKEVHNSILRTVPDGDKAYDGPLGQLLLECYRSYFGKPHAKEVPVPHTRRFGKWFASVLNEGIYSRVEAGVIQEVNRRKGDNGGTTWQYLPTEVRNALMPVIMVMINNIRRDGWYNMDFIIRGLDEFFPRYEQGYKRPRFN